MFFLFGERIHSDSKNVGKKDCGVCGKQQPFSQVVETRYFCLFGIRLLPIEKSANYLLCNQCNNAFPLELEEATRGDPAQQPTQLALIKRVLVYIQLGYAMHARRDVVQDICIKVTGFEFQAEEISQQMQDLDSAKVDLFDSLRSSASSLNLQGKQQVIEAAFLITYACCEIQYEDRLRINLIGNAMDVSIEFISSVIEHVHSQGCYGVRRILPSQQRIS